MDDNNETNERTPLQRNKSTTKRFTKLHKIPWWKRPSPWILFPVFGLYQLGQQMQKIMQPNAFISLACKTTFNEDISFQDPRCSSAEIQEFVSKFTAFSSFIAGIAAVWIMPRISSLSERYGRKSAFIYFLILNCLCVSSYLIALQWWYIVGFKFTLLSFFLLGASGTDMLLWVAISSYVADCVQPSKRTHVMSYSTAVEMGASIFGPMVVSGIVKKFDNLMYGFVWSLAFELLALIYCIFILPESKSKKSMDKAKESYSKNNTESWWSTVYHTFNIVKPVKTIWRVATNETPILKRTILALTVLEIGYTAAGEFKGSPEFLYFQMAFGWSAIEIGYMMSMVAICKVFLLGLLVPFLLRQIPKWLWGEDDLEDKEGVSKLELWIIRFGFIMEVIGCIMFAYAQNSKQTYSAAIVESFGIVARPLMQSAFMNTINKNELSDFLYSKGALTVIIAITIASSGMSVYSWLVKYYPVLIFIFTALMFFAALCVSPWIKTEQGPSDPDSDSDSSSSGDNV